MKFLVEFFKKIEMKTKTTFDLKDKKSAKTPLSLFTYLLF